MPGSFASGQQLYGASDPPRFENSWIGLSNPSYQAPDGWTALNAVPSYWTDFKGNDTYVISAAGARTPGGKGLTASYDIRDDWTGGRLDKWLGYPGYPELYIRFYAKFPSSFYWSHGAMFKQFRLNARASLLGYQGPGYGGINGYSSGPENYGELSDNACWYVPQWGYYDNYGGYSLISILGWGLPRKHTIIDYNLSNSPWPGTSGGIFRDPVAGVIVNPGNNEKQGDNTWHCYEWRQKINSAPGVADGVIQYWLDGVLKYSNTSVVWVQSVPWQANYAYTSTYDNSARVERITPLNSNKVFRLIGPSTANASAISGSTQPNWASVTTQGQTITDNQVTWMLEYDSVGFNWLMFSDNFINPYYANSAKQEMQVFYDDIVVSTSYVGPDGGSVSSPSSVKNLRIVQ
jgi:hypothetical protein